MSTTTMVTVSDTTAALAPLPDAVLTDPLVRFQADWYCESSKTAYASATDIDSALAVRLASAGIDRAAYDTFVARLGVDSLRRAGVLQVFLRTCHLMAGGPALAQGAAASTTTSSTSPSTSASPSSSASTTVNTSSYDDDWYHAYYCWIVGRYGNTWNLDSSLDCDVAAAGTITTSPVPTALIPSTKAVASLLTSTSAPVRANANSWVTLNWTVIGGNADLFQITATADKGVSVTYPEKTRNYSSLYRDEHLANLELDYTALKLTVPAGVTGNVTVSLRMTSQTSLRDNDENFTVTVPVAGS